MIPQRERKRLPERLVFGCNYPPTILQPLPTNSINGNAKKASPKAWAQVFSGHDDNQEVAILFGNVDATELENSLSTDSIWTSVGDLNMQPLVTAGLGYHPLDSGAISLTIVHRVEDFDVWEQSFKDYEPARREAGVRIQEYFRTTNDPNNLVLIFNVDDYEVAKKLGTDPEMRLVMKSAGVINQPELSYWMITR